MKRLYEQSVGRHLSLAQRILLRIFLSAESRLSGFRGKLDQGLERLRVGLASETEQTKKMLEIYQRQTLGKANPEEMEWAHHQFRDILKAMGLGVLLVMPLAPVTLPLVVKLGEKMGIAVLPDSFLTDVNENVSSEVVPSLEPSD